MRLVLRPLVKTSSAILGSLSDGDTWHICYTLEDAPRLLPGAAKRPGRTAIPAGEYDVEMVNSPKFGWVPTLLNVPGFTHIRIHAGNTVEDTEGCILVGTDVAAHPDATRFLHKYTLLNSRKALLNVVRIVQAALDAGDRVVLTIYDF